MAKADYQWQKKRPSRRSFPLFMLSQQTRDLLKLKASNAKDRLYQKKKSALKLRTLFRILTLKVELCYLIRKYTSNLPAYSMLY